MNSSTISEELCALLEMVDYMLTENGLSGYTENMLTEANRRSTEDKAMKLLKQKVQEAEEKEQAFNQLVQQQEGRRAGESNELMLRHTEERRKEAEEKRQYETKRESLEEAVRSHSAILQLQMKSAIGKTQKKLPANGDECEGFDKKKDFSKNIVIKSIFKFQHVQNKVPFNFF